MKKSKKRLLLEKELRNAHMESVDLVRRTAQEMFGKSFSEIEGDEQKLRQVVEKVRLGPWQNYVGRQAELLELEKKEGFPAFAEYAGHIDFVGAHIPQEAREDCYHPFSGLDFLWARIFNRVLNEDFGFSAHDLSWWQSHEYMAVFASLSATLKDAGLIPRDRRIDSLGGDSFTQRSITDKINKPGGTLLVKRGHDNLTFIRKRFLERGLPLRFGAIVFEGGFYDHSFEETEEALDHAGYGLSMRYGREVEDLEYAIPYALGPGKNCAIFVPKHS